MKAKKTLRVIIFAVILLLIGLGTYYFIGKQNKKDSIEDFIKKNNYPFNGYYSEDAHEFSEDALIQMIQNNPDISKYTENSSIKIDANGTISITTTLKELNTLIEQNQSLSTYKLWAKSLSGQTVSAALKLSERTDGNAEIKLKSIKIAALSIDPALLTSFIDNSQIQKQLGKIPYSSIYVTQGSISFTKVTPLFLQT